MGVSVMSSDFVVLLLRSRGGTVDTSEVTIFITLITTHPSHSRISQHSHLEIRHNRMVDRWRPRFGAAALAVWVLWLSLSPRRWGSLVDDPEVRVSPEA